MNSTSPSALVLYAEDDENDAFFMERAFARLNRGYGLRIVANGKAAVDYLAGSGRFADRNSHPLPMLLILDVKMPEMSGLEVLRWVRARPEFERLPIVMFTSSTQESDIAYSHEHRANAYLVKPSNAENLAPVVADLLGAARQVTDATVLLPVPGNRLIRSD